MPKLLLITDAWAPQTNGVVTTYRHVIAENAKAGLETHVVHPGLFRRLPCPGYPEIPLAIDPWKVGRMIDAAAPDHVHVAVEGPIGLAARRALLRRGLAFTTAFHTRLPEYVHERIRFIKPALGYRYLRWFHRPSRRILVTTRSMAEVLAGHGFERMVVWGRGVDTNLFRPRPRTPRAVREPVFLYVGRVAVEKNIEAFLRLDLPGSKIVVGDGPSRPALERRHPDAHFLGYRYGEALAELYAQADVFVFPSKTDTFGLVMLEAMACGTPVAAYPVPGPLDVVKQGVTGVLDEDLRRAALAALELDRNACRAWAERHSWADCARVFRENLVPANGAGATAPAPDALRNCG